MISYLILWRLWVNNMAYVEITPSCRRLAWGIQQLEMASSTLDLLATRSVVPVHPYSIGPPHILVRMNTEAIQLGTVRFDGAGVIW